MSSARQDPRATCRVTQRTGPPFARAHPSACPVDTGEEVNGRYPGSCRSVERLCQKFPSSCKCVSEVVEIELQQSGDLLGTEQIQVEQSEGAAIRLWKQR